MSKYEPLTRFLRECETETIRLGFDEVEAILGFTLPPSAYAHSEWWANNPTGHSHARSWVEAGWRTQKVDRKNRTLVFQQDAAVSAKRARTLIYGRMKGGVVFTPGVDLTEPTGELWNAERGILHE